MINTIIFDLGGVLIDWNPRYLFRKIFTSADEMEHFLTHICTPDWNEEQDAGRLLQEATDELVEKHPEYAEQIRAFYGRWEEMLGGTFDETVQTLKKLKESGQYKLYALTNWSAETFPIALSRYEFLSWFDGIVMSGEEKSRKPFPEFYTILLTRYQIAPNDSLFIDDNLRNVKAARALGIATIHLESPKQIETALQEYNVHI
ncbi:HAD family phosphatase [Xanthocytophaga agilis]|uniref:HAD family phosphatase n=1 Tax=Xanthocytophaga agilis TaxID=3048010 RepID=A0AAE3RDC7_9BACT|nr:HAD family phosphatase [Xanthocytophaga agilis]MDJ1506529.1 HAD family phosphatase [Xanthocytophaga agilis]